MKRFGRYDQNLFMHIYQAPYAKYDFKHLSSIEIYRVIESNQPPRTEFICIKLAR